MGLDNGIINKRGEDLLYWRKCYCVRELILDYLAKAYGSAIIKQFGGEYEITKHDLKELLLLLIKNHTKEFYDGQTIWEWDELQHYKQDYQNLLTSLPEMKDEVFIFYDSF